MLTKLMRKSDEKTGTVLEGILGSKKVAQRNAWSDWNSYLRIFGNTPPVKS